MDLGLNNKRALVTGASKGLGKAVAGALRAEGATVAICARDAGRIAAAANEIGAATRRRSFHSRSRGEYRATGDR